MSSKSGTGIMQQTSLFSFFGGGGGSAAAGNAGTTKSKSGTSSKKPASTKSRAKTKADASKKGGNAKGGGGKKIDVNTAGGSSKSNNKTKKNAARASAPPLATTSTKKRRIASGKDDEPSTGAAATSTTTPRKPSKVIENVPFFSTFSYAKNESAAAAADDTPMSAATTRTAASTPSSLPSPSSASTTPSDAAANADGDVEMKAVEDATNNADDNELPSAEKDVIDTVMEDDAQALNRVEENDNDNDDDDNDGESETKNDKSNSIEDSDDNNDDSSSDSDAESTTAAQGEYRLSEYELLRLRNIERNNRRLAELGLAGGWPSNSNEQRQKAKKKSRKKVKGDTTKTRTPAMPTRRSTRARRTVLEAAAEGEGTFGASNLLADNNVPTYQEKAEIEEEPVEEVFTVSPMLEYAMNADNTANTDASAALKEWPTDAQPSDIQCLEPIGKRLAPPNGLGAIYSLQFYPQKWCPEQRSENQTWIVGAGKAGIISLWDCNWSRGSSTSAVEEDDMIDPVLSWKAHSGRWVADVRFLPSTSGSEGAITKSPPSRLLSAANDGSVCLWDLSTVSSLNGSPKLLCRTGKELHRSGIFAMDVDVGQHQIHVATGSKDKTVAVTTLEKPHWPFWVSDYHTAKVGAVAFCGKGTSLLASASDDGTIAVHDIRADGKKQVVAELVDAHYRPHSVSWDPLSENNLMTAGLDDQVKVFDIRSLDKPLYTYQGHVPTLSKYKRIHHPVFYNPCQRTTSSELFVLSGGESSAALSMFRNQDAKDAAVSVYSRGRLPADCGDAGCLAIQGQRVASTVDGGEVLLLAPKLNQG